MKKVILVSGYFNPLHKGHLEYFKKAKEHGDLLWVIVNSDYQRELKGSKEFQDQEERLAIIRALSIVDFAYIAKDKDRTVKETIQFLHSMHKDEYTFAFANGGDQNNDTIPEFGICDKLKIELIDGLGDKIQSSSWLLSKD